MITIINHGKLNKKYCVYCSDCGCEFTCENSDFHNINSSLGQEPWVNCPECGYSIKYKNCSEIKLNRENAFGYEPYIVDLNGGFNF